MRILVYEWTCCQPLTAATAALRPQGWAMLSAILEDLARVPEFTPVAMLATEFAPVPFPCIRFEPCDERRTFLDLASRSDECLVIAPELEDILYQRCRWVEKAGGRLLGPSSQAVRLTGDKLAQAGNLESHGIPTPPTVPLLEANPITYPLVCKRRDGAGSTDTCLVHSGADLRRLCQGTEAKRHVVQPFIPGKAVSVAFLVGPKRRVPLLPATQEISEDGCFHYLGGSAPLPTELADRALTLADRAMSTIEGLRGYVGVDLVLGAECDQVIEINPRLTTSYIGIRGLALSNLAEAMVRIAQGADRAKVRWRTGTVSWSADSA